MAVAREEQCPECGCLFRIKNRGKPRSVPQHRRFFGLVKAAFANWPERHKFQPRTAEELRAWLLYQAGHCEVVKTVRCETVEPRNLAAVFEASFRAARAHCFVEVQGNTVRIIAPHSTAFEKLPHMHAVTIYSLIQDFVTDIFGVPADQLLKKAKEAA